MSPLLELELKQPKGRISTTTPQTLACLFHSLRPILRISCPNSMEAIVKVHGPFVPSRNRHLHRYYLPPSSRLRQCPDHYTIRAGRNLPDKEFRYLRTSCSYGRRLLGLRAQTFEDKALPPQRASTGRCRLAVCFIFLFRTAMCFAKHCLDLFSAPHLSRNPLSRSEGQLTSSNRESPRAPQYFNPTIMGLYVRYVVS